MNFDSIYDFFLSISLKYKDIFQCSTAFFSTVSFIIYWILFFKHRCFKKKISLQNGKYHFRIKRKNFNSTDLTTIVSNLYFNGGLIPGELRQEIFKITGTEGEKIEDK